MKSLHAALGAALAMSAGLPVLAQQPANTPAADASQLEEVVIFARGVARQQQQVTAEQIDYLPAGTSPLKAIEKLPGVNFQSADPFGSYEWSTRIVVRGFNQNQLGFTLDGVPLGDMSYGNHNGLHISRAVPSEDVGRVSLSQGAGALGTASTSNLGGTLEFFTLDPASDLGGRIDLTGGSDSTRRIFGHFDTGSLGENGPRISLSAVDGTTDKWKGSGEQQQRMYSLKAVQPIGDTGSVTAYYNYSDRAERDYQDLSFDIIRRRGEDWDNWAPDWSAAVAAAQACAASGFSNAVVCDDAYWDAAGIREDSLAYVGLDLPSDDGLSFSARVYMHQNEGQGLWGTPYVPTPGGAPLSVRTTEYDIDRKGALATVGWTLGGHALEAGVWIENNDFNQARRFYPESNLAGPTQSFTSFRSNPLLTQWEYAFETKTLQYHLQDEFSIGETLKFVAGFKGMTVENSATTITGPNKSGTIEAQENFLPQLGFTWAPWEGGELFGLAARNARAFVSANTAGPFSTSAAGFAAIRDVLKPETSDTIELGWRFRGESVEGVLAAYRIKFKDRLLAIQQGPGIVGNPSVLANVGGVSTNGFEAAVNWRPMQHLAWFTSFAWNDSTFDQNYTTNGNVILVGGKTVPDAPEMMLKTELTYDNGMFFARADANYTDGRYYTFLNQGSVPSYTLFNASAGFRFADLAMFEELSVQAAVTNIADKFYISTVGSNGFVNADPNGTAQTLLRGAPRQVFVSVKAKF
jgi:iron complex outermembrane receptor protein